MNISNTFTFKPIIQFRTLFTSSSTVAFYKKKTMSKEYISFDYFRHKYRDHNIAWQYILLTT